MAGEITVHLRTLRSIKIKYFSLEGATKANDFLCSSILALLTHNFFIERFYQQTTSVVQNHLLLLVFICEHLAYNVVLTFFWGGGGG